MESEKKKNKKKTIPKGYKRVVREKMYEDANGYMVIEEESDVEEMTPEEIEAKKKPIPKK